MQNKKQRNAIIIAIAVLACLLIVLLATYFSGAWFVAKRKAEGSLQFVDGIKINYAGLYEDSSTPSSSNLKLAYLVEKPSGEVELNPLEETNVMSSMVYSLANPTLSAKEGTVPFYLRTRFNIKFYFKNASGEEVLLTDENRDEFIATTLNYRKNDAPYVIINERDLFLSLPVFDTTKFVEYNGWYYLGSAEGAVASLEDITLIKNEYNGEETQAYTIFKLDENEKVLIQLDDEIDYGENMPFTKIEFSLDIQAIEELAISNWNS